MSEMNLTELDEETFQRFLKLTHDLTGITLQANRKSMLLGRIRSRVLELKLGSVQGYLEAINASAEERRLFVNLITTNETYFYRTPRVWEYLEKEYLPSWFARHAGQTFHAWSAAASSGEEAHTLGIVLQNFHDQNPDFRYQITGTDINDEVLAEANLGIYRGRSIELFHQRQPGLFAKYMREKDAGDYGVIPEIKKHIQFRQHNLFTAAKFGKPFDLVFLRNVLIYFRESDQEKVLRQITNHLATDSLLVIGESESLNRLKTPFSYLQPLIYRYTPSAVTKGEAA